VSLEGELRPLRPGAEVGIPGGPRGSLGLLLQNATGDRFALSCSHVLASCGDAHEKTPLIQPANPYVAAATISVGELTATFTRIEFGSGVNHEDFAVARVSMTIACVPSFAGGAPPPRTVFVGDGADMRDCATELTGIVTRGARGVVSTKQTGYATIGYPGFGVARFAGVVEYRTSCSEGDSGAAVMLADTDVVLGIHIGGESAREIGYLLPIASFLQSHGFHLFGG